MSQIQVDGSNTKKGFKMISRCAICGGKVMEKKVSEEIKVGNDFVIVEGITAGVCMDCGERYYPPGVVDKLRSIEKNLLKREERKKLAVIGNAYRLRYPSFA